MLPRDHDIANLALYAPRTALALLLGVPRVPFVDDILLQFTSTAVDAPSVQNAFQNNVTQDTLIERVSFSLSQPNSFPGSPFQSLFLAQLKQCTGVGVIAQVFGGPKYTLNDSFTPLENLADILAVTWPNGWPLDKQSNVRLQAVLTTTPTSVPYDVTVTFLGWQFIDKCLDDMSDDEARKRLANMGIKVIDPALGKA